MPTPLALVSVTTDAMGRASLPFVLPPGLSPGWAFFFQFWIDDPGASFDLSASNGLEGLTG